MPVTIGDGLAFCGRPLTVAQLELIRGITREFANLAWTELAATICELLQWRRPNGKLKARECYLFLRELHRRGWLPWLTPRCPERVVPRWRNSSPDQPRRQPYSPVRCPSTARCNWI